MSTSYDVNTKKLSIGFLPCDQGQLYTLTKRIKYIVEIPGLEKPIYCQSAEAVQSCLAENHIKFSMWQLYRHLKREPDHLELKLRGAIVTRA